MKQTVALFDNKTLSAAALAALKKFHPRQAWGAPIVFITYVSAVLTLLLTVYYALTANPQLSFALAITFWLFVTVYAANFSESLAEVRGRAQAASLRKTKEMLQSRRMHGETSEIIPAAQLNIGDIVLVIAGEMIPCDGEVIKGIASVDESAITGESAPVIRESGGDRSAVTGGTRVLSDQLYIRVTQAAGQSFLDKMISLVEGAVRQRTPNEIALNFLLLGLTFMLFVVVATIPFFKAYFNATVDYVALIALFITLIPTTIGGLLSAIGISGMHRLMQNNVLAMSGQAVEAAGDIDVLLLDKTGTITLGNRLASELIPVAGVTIEELADAAQLSSLRDETPEGRSVVVLAKERYNLRARELAEAGVTFIPFTAQTRMSGIDYAQHTYRKGAVDAIIRYLKDLNGAGYEAPVAFIKNVETIAKSGGTPLAVAKDNRLLGLIHLKDMVKGGIRERFAELRRMGIRTVMITGDNPLTAAAIAAEAGVDDFIAEATPESKLNLIRREQGLGKLVAMCGDGTNDAPALAQADVAVAMSSGTAAAREAGNMVDLDSDPTKLITIVTVGKQLLMTRGALTTFSFANDLAKCFAVLPALFAPYFPHLEVLNIMHLATSDSAVLAAIIFNTLIIPALVPLALRGVGYRAAGAAALLSHNLTWYGLTGLIVPFIGIKIIDMVLQVIV